MELEKRRLAMLEKRPELEKKERALGNNEKKAVAKFQLAMLSIQESMAKKLG